MKMDENNVTFSKEFLKKAKDAAIINAILAFTPEEQVKPTKMMFQAFARRGVSPQTVVDVIAKMAMEGGFNDE